ncbi:MULTISPECIES: hypothetical protein [Nostoc]|uniref:Uncharacterized protein n=2 Tax=Nostoc TaxID=1177 RepID=A0ABR8IKU0_9NOSO|nr:MULTISPECIES: hypothetical protein [Nostoc]MBD2565966.1 hypothetical protein [Nostoc linckia FACHB-391]MBD2651808.1 hypothetical protein [Nostoc foliaceum FACHB-393]
MQRYRRHNFCTFGKKQADHETLLDLKHVSIKALGHADDFDEAQNPSNPVKITVSWSAQSLALTDSAPL